MEIRIKHAAGRLELRDDPSRLVAELLEEACSLGARRLNTRFAWRRCRGTIATRSTGCRWPRRWVEGLTLVTADPSVLAYGMPAIDVRK